MPSSNTSVTYPPAAHLSTNQASAVTQSQPAPRAAMSLDPAEQIDQSKEAAKAERIRGGCIPCPGGGICYIIPIPCCC